MLLVPSEVTRDKYVCLFCGDKDDIDDGDDDDNDGENTTDNGNGFFRLRD